MKPLNQNVGTDKDDFQRLKSLMEREGLVVQQCNDLSELVHYFVTVEKRLQRQDSGPDYFRYIPKRIQPILDELRHGSSQHEQPEPSVLLLGEAGLPFESIARSIHQGSRRSKGPWMVLNCATSDDQSLLYEWYGYEKGAFLGANEFKRGVFELASGGTLVLNNIERLSHQSQAELFKVIRTGHFKRVGGNQDIPLHVRFISFGDLNLNHLVEEGQFLKDLYSALGQYVTKVSALRERSDEVLSEAMYFGEQVFGTLGKRFSGFDEVAEKFIKTYSWPGNDKEMLMMIQRAALLVSEEEPIKLQDLSITKSNQAPEQGAMSLSNVDDLMGEFGFAVEKKRWSKSFEKEYIRRVLGKNKGNVSAAAREAKLDRSNFLRLLRKHGIKSSEFKFQEPLLRVA